MEDENTIVPNVANNGPNWLQRLKSEIDAKLNKKSVYSWAVLVLVPLSELMALWALRLGWKCNSWLPGILWGVLIALMAALWVIGRRYKHKFNIKTKILTRLLANAVVPRPLGVCYLLSFAIHIGWIGNAIANLFVGSVCLADAIVSVTACTIGIIFLTVFFPDGRIEEEINTSVFVSGISLCYASIVKDDDKNPGRWVIPIYNIIPLVSILDLMFVKHEVNTTNNKLLIMNTLAHYQPGKHGKTALADFIKQGGTDEEFWNNCYVDISGLEDSVNKANRLGLTVITINKKAHVHLDWRQEPEGDQVKSLLIWLIKFTAKLKYPEFTASIDQISFDFMKESCNYDLFNECYIAVENAVKDIDKPGTSLHFNLTPGTGIVGSLMTLFAIDDNRRLYYYPQNTPDAVMTEANKSKVPLENLLSQALENIRNN